MRYDLYLFDLDGTLYRGSEAVPHAQETVGKLRSSGAGIAFLTNNSSQLPKTVASRLFAMGFGAAENEVFTSAMVAAAYCRDNHLRSAFVVGEEGLVGTLTQAGIELAPGFQPDAVVVGISRTFNYVDLADAMTWIRNGARFVATNADATYPVEGGRELPGAGAIVSAIRTASGVEPIVVGKPEPAMVEMALSRFGVTASKALVVGDRLETDIEAGRRAGCDTHLVLSGVTQSAPDGQSHSEDLRGLP